MKALPCFLILFLFEISFTYAQQTYSLREIHYRIDTGVTLARHNPLRASLTSLSTTFTANPPNMGVFGVEGIGSLSTEELSKANGAGKISFVVNPNPIFYGNGRCLQSFVHFSLNKNATNSNDSLLPSTILFPELGNVSFNGTYELLWKFQQKCGETQYHQSLFIDFAVKDIKASIIDTVSKTSKSYHFNTLSYSIGTRFLLQHYYVNSNHEIKNANVSIAPYINFMNVPDEDTADYRLLIGDSVAPDVLVGFGLKISAQFSNFIFFSDLRHTFYDEKHQINNRDLKGFTSNIGVGISGELFRF